MKIMSKDRILGSTVLCVSALFAILFGGYLIYEKVYLSLLTAHTHERAGIIFRADDPVFFWVWVTTYALAGTWIVITGFFFFVAARKYLTGSFKK